MIRRALEHVGAQAPAELRLDAPALKVQADSRSEEWVRRVHEHLAALEEPTTVTAA